MALRFNALLLDGAAGPELRHGMTSEEERVECGAPLARTPPRMLRYLAAAGPSSRPWLGCVGVSGSPTGHVGCMLTSFGCGTLEGVAETCYSFGDVHGGSKLPSFRSVGAWPRSGRACRWRASRPMQSCRWWARGPLRA